MADLPILKALAVDESVRTRIKDIYGKLVVCRALRFTACLIRVQSGGMSTDEFDKEYDSIVVPIKETKKSLQVFWDRVKVIAKRYFHHARVLLTAP